MNLKMIRLSKPNPDNLFSNYENQLEPQYFFTSSVSKTLFENSQRTLLQISDRKSTRLNSSHSTSSRMPSSA